MKITLQNAKRVFDEWRSNRKTQSEKIPDALMEIASTCVFKFGITDTVKKLNLNYGRLRQAMEKYPFLENEIKVEARELLPCEFIEANLSNKNINLEKKNIKSSEFINFSEPLFELENKMGIRVRVFSPIEGVHKNVLKYFLSGG